MASFHVTASIVGAVFLLKLQLFSFCHQVVRNNNAYRKKSVSQDFLYVVSPEREWNNGKIRRYLGYCGNRGKRTNKCTLNQVIEWKRDIIPTTINSEF